MNINVPCGPPSFLSLISLSCVSVPFPFFPVSSCFTMSLSTAIPPGSPPSCSFWSSPAQSPYLTLGLDTFPSDSVISQGWPQVWPPQTALQTWQGLFSGCPELVTLRLLIPEAQILSLLVSVASVSTEDTSQAVTGVPGDPESILGKSVFISSLLHHIPTLSPCSKHTELALPCPVLPSLPSFLSQAPREEDSCLLTPHRITPEMFGPWANGGRVQEPHPPVPAPSKRVESYSLLFPSEGSQ